MSIRESAQSIDDAAAYWAAKIDRGLNEQEQADLEAWLAGDTRRVGALGRARAAWFHAERASALESPAAHSVQNETRRPVISRRALVAGGTAIAASLVAGVGIGAFTLLRNRPHKFSSEMGEIRRIALEDGSAITLDTASRVRVSFESFERRVFLLTGKAFFEVAHDAARPFLVEAENIVVRAVGTGFSVSARTQQPIAVVVSDGQVMVSRQLNGAATSTARLDANMRMDIPRIGDVSIKAAHALAPEELDRTLAWREGKLAFAGETLAAAAEQFAQYSSVHIAVDASLATEQITGLFAANDPRGFAKAIAVSLNARFEDDENEVRLTRPATADK